MKKKGGGEGNSSGGADESKLVCLPSFSVLITQLPILKKGLGLIMRDGKVYLGKTMVGALSARQYRMVVECEADGIGYRGAVAASKKEGKNYFYGLFEKHRV